jgi:hypothetical protein
MAKELHRLLTRASVSGLLVRNRPEDVIKQGRGELEKV